MKKLFIMVSLTLATAAAVVATTIHLTNQTQTEVQSERSPGLSPQSSNPYARQGSEQTVRYQNPQYGFEFLYPGYVNIRDFTSPPVSRFDRDKINLHVNAEHIHSVSPADGPCGTASPEAYEKQKSAFDQVEPGESFDTGFRKTNYGVEQSKLLVNPQGVKLAYGIGTCQGLAGEEDLGSFDYIALSFKDDTRVSLRIPLTKEQSGRVKVKDLEEKAKEIAEGRYSGEAQEIYDSLVTILNSLRFRSLDL